MKRNENIVPLSRDHHFGLLCCWKIRQGLKMGIEHQRIKKYILHFWEDHLAQHFREEENILFILKDHPGCQRAIEEHRQIRQLIQDIELPNAGADEMTNLANIMDRHIRFEERELFPELEQTLSEEQLQTIGHELHHLHSHKSTDNYPDEFWVRPRE